MEFHINMTCSTADLGAIENVIRAIDPSALVDLDPHRQTVRVAASVGVAQLVDLINQAGYPLAQHQVAPAPSICCGGCG